MRLRKILGKIELVHTKLAIRLKFRFPLIQPVSSIFMRNFCENQSWGNRVLSWNCIYIFHGDFLFGLILSVFWQSCSKLACSTFKHVTRVLLTNAGHFVYMSEQQSMLMVQWQNKSQRKWQSSQYSIYNLYK